MQGIRSLVHPTHLGWRGRRASAARRPRSAAEPRLDSQEADSATFRTVGACSSMANTLKNTATALGHYLRLRLARIVGSRVVRSLSELEGLVGVVPSSTELAQVAQFSER